MSNARKRQSITDARKIAARAALHDMQACGENINVVKEEVTRFLKQKGVTNEQSKVSLHTAQ